MNLRLAPPFPVAGEGDKENVNHLFHYSVQCYLR